MTEHDTREVQATAKVYLNLDEDGWSVAHHLYEGNEPVDGDAYTDADEPVEDAPDLPSITALGALILREDLESLAGLIKRQDEALDKYRTEDGDVRESDLRDFDETATDYAIDIRDSVTALLHRLGVTA